MDKAVAQMDVSQRAILSSLSGMQSGIQGAITDFKALGGVIAGSLGGAAILEWSKNVVESTANLKKLSNETGSTVESLSRIANVAQYSGTSFEDLKRNVDRLAAGMAGAEELNTKTAKTLELLGISAKDPAEALQQVAEKFNTFADGANKAGLARDLFGKGGVAFLSTLKDMAEATQIVGTRTTEQAEASEHLEKQLRSLTLQSQQLKDALLSDVVPAIDSVITHFNQARLSGLGFLDALGVAVFGTRDLGNVVEAAAKKVADLQQRLDEAKAKNNQGSAYYFGPGIQADIEKTTSDLAAAQKQLASLQALQRRVDGSDPSFADNTSGAGKPKAPHPVGGADGVAKITEFTLEMQRLQTEANKADAALEQLFRTDRITDAEKEFLDFVGSDKWDKLTAQEQSAAAAKAKDVIATEALTNRLKDWAKAAAEVADALKKQRDEDQKTSDQITGNADKLSHAFDEQAKYINITDGAERQFRIGLDALDDAYDAGRISLEDYTAATGKLQASWSNLAAAKAAKQAADEAQKAFEEASRNIEQSLENAIGNGLKHGQSIGQEVRNALEQMFKTLVLRPLLQPIAAGIAGSFGGLANAAGGVGSALTGGGGGLGGLGNLSGLSNLFGGGGLAGLGTSFATSGLGAGLGLSTVGAASDAALTLGAGAATEVGAAAAGAGGLALTGAGSALVAAIPVVGWALAIAAIAYSIFGNKGGGPKGGGFASAGNIAGLRNIGSGDSGRYFTPNTADSQVASLVGGLQTSYQSSLADLGGTGTAGFALGYDTDPKGTAQNRVSAGAVVNGQTVYAARDQNAGRDDATLQAQLTLQSQRALLAALQASNLPKAIGDILNSLTASTASGDQITRVLALGGAYKQLGDLIARNPVDDAIKGLATQSQGAYGAFMQQRDAMGQLLTTYTGTTQQTAALTAASQQFYLAAVQVVAQIQQIKTSIGEMFGSTIRSLTLQTLDKPGQYNFLRSEATSLFSQLQTSSDPATIQHLSDLINQDINQAFGLVDPSQRAGLLPQFTDYINQVNATAQQHLQDVQDTITAAAVDTLTSFQSAIADAATTIQGAADDVGNAAANLANTNVNITFRANVPGDTEVNVSGGG